MTRAAVKTPRGPRSNGAASDVASLKSTIGAMTGRVPSSSDPRYLRQRLHELQVKRAAGDDIRHKSSPIAVMSVSMPVTARDALDRILKKERCGASDLVRRALASWAIRYGYRAEAQEIDNEQRS